MSECNCHKDSNGTLKCPVHSERGWLTRQIKLASREVALWSVDKQETMVLSDKKWTDKDRERAHLKRFERLLEEIQAEREWLAERGIFV